MIEVPGGLYHIISRGNNRRKIFRSHYLSFTSSLSTGYSRYFNRKDKKIGHLFQ